MPSGAKKRKAAKKKREQEANNNNNSSISTDNHQGNDDPKSHDETETDGGEVGTSVSQDQHNHQHPFNEGNEEYEKGGPSPSDSLANKNKPMEVVTGDAEGSLQVESEDSIAVNIESKSVSIEHVDSSKESHDEDDRSSSSSSFSNESQDFEKKSKEANDEEKEIGSFSEEVKQISENEKLVKEADSNSVLETASADLVDPVVPISETEKFVIEIAQVENPEVLEVVESCFEEDEDKLLPVSNETAEVSPATVVPKKNEEVVESCFEKDEYKLLPVSNEIGVVSPATVVPKKNEKVVESCFAEDEDKLLPVPNEIAEVSPATVVPKKNEDKVFPISDENVGASANVVGSSAYGNVGKTLVSSASHSAETGNGEEKTKYTDARQITENKPPLACGPRVAERTSWMSCCGIFDVLTGSK
ncbi:PREDICTED: transcription factor mef2A isoform X1 [Populus euphratica]|uniref:Transcription factor mef2A isoform X1 n=1 Tax=Populus euphratica TaxID=75702 RepID=A0AAJ6T6Y3_POPEU|nr:PREDICTED: transcription factor mef2A isoform X1 [Populus euphratica]XP_011005828.1 PREDICTED: transcription factor mef2A isoform X1 [Populus euphratica]